MTEMVLRKNRSPQRLDGLAQTLYKSKLRGEQDPAKPLNYWYILEHKSDMERERVLSMRSAVAGRINIWLAVLALLSGLAVSLAGCSGGSLGGVFGGSGEGATSSNVPSIAFAPIIGPPAAIGKYLNGQLVAAVQQKKITVVADIDKTATYTVQGFLAQSNEAKSEKFSFIWDVRDKSGNRVHRILGEEAVPAKTGAKPWSSINNAALQKIAAKTAEDLAVWLPKQGAAAATPAARSTPAAQHPPVRHHAVRRRASQRGHRVESRNRRGGRGRDQRDHGPDEDLFGRDGVRGCGPEGEVGVAQSQGRKKWCLPLDSPPHSVK